MRIYILSGIKGLDKSDMKTSSEKYEYEIAKSLSKFADVEILSLKVPFGEGEEDGRLVLTGIGVPVKNKLRLGKYKKIKEILKRGDRTEKAVFIFWGYDLQLLIGLLFMKRKFKIMYTPFIYDHHGTAVQSVAKKWKRMILNIYYQTGLKLVRYFDAFIFFQKSAPGELGIKKPYFVSKPGAVPGQRRLVKRSEEESFHIAFCGTLTGLNGIDVLIEAFCSAGINNAKLHIYGDGPLEKFVEEMAIQNAGIIFHGRVSEAELRNVYANSDLLVNLRRLDDYAMKFAFPSKLFEYMETGCPVLTTRCMDTKEFEECTFVVDSLEPECVADTIKQVWMDRDCAIERAERAVRYVGENFSYDKQAGEMFIFLQNTCKGNGMRE